ncbi:MAG: indole-3-glycerol phosphate synthase TrpC [bacterium]
MILDDIVAYKKIFIAECKERRPLKDVAAEAQRAAPTHSLRAALLDADGIAIIAEVKKASPSKGVFRKDFDPVRIARSYEKHGASAISVLTDEKFFQGSLEYLRQIREAASVPLLRKDFILDEYQIHEARGAGADAILLITSLLSDETLAGFMRRAQEMGLECLVEVHSEEETRRAVGADVKLLGINNRDLASADFKTDLRTTEKLLPLIPKEVTVVSESGIRSAKDVAYLRGLGVKGILVGESLMLRSDPGEGLEKLKRFTTEPQ